MNRSILTAPKLSAPSQTTDCHIHIYGEKGEYPVVPGTRFAAPAATLAQYRAVMRRLNIARAVIVQPAAYGTDNRATLDALGELGPNARAVAVITPQTSRVDVEHMNDLGVRGARFLLLPGSVMSWHMLAPVARLVADFGWHVQLQFDGRELPDRVGAIRDLPCDAVIDHNGKFLEPVDADHAALRVLLTLLDSGRVWVKASAPYETSRTGPPEFSDVGLIARKLISANPDRIVWATNWPHGGERHKPDDAMLMDVLLDWAPDVTVRQRILVDNPRALYEF